MCTHNCAVLIAPPGAGKTTEVPLALIGEEWVDKRKIIMLEPRRIAARTAAERLSALDGSKVGDRIGLRARTITKVSPQTRVEVVTEGVFVRQILDQPELQNVALIIFDEFHERSLDADFSLALALDAQAGLREDLRILVMSATLDGGAIATHMGNCPVIACEGQSHPIETYYLGRDPALPLQRRIAAAVRRAHRETSGSVLVFLPGQSEIHRALLAIEEHPLGEETIVVPLHGGMDPQAQDKAIAPAPVGQRKVILATSIAETSLTIDGITAVVDSGLAREPRFDAGARLTRLATVKVSRAAAEQRRGRAGRLGPGNCYRLWSQPETESLTAFATPEIKTSDLSSMLADCAAWGVTDPQQLTWLDKPPASAIGVAREDLAELAITDRHGRLTEFGALVQRMPLPPRLGTMICKAAATGQQQTAAQIAALLSERGLGGQHVDLVERLDRMARDRSTRAKSIRHMTQRWARSAINPNEHVGLPSTTCTLPTGKNWSPGALLAHAFPDRIAKARGQLGQFLLANGTGAFLPPHEPLADAPFLVIADLQGAGADRRITSAAAITESEIEAIAADRIETRHQLSFDSANGAVRVLYQRALGAVILSKSHAPASPGPETTAKLCEAIAAANLAPLPWTSEHHELRQRVAYLRSTAPDEFPDLETKQLATTLSEWLGPFISNKTRLDQISAEDLSDALAVLTPWPVRQALDDGAPTQFTAPSNRKHPINYDGEHAPSVSIRVQELYGLDQHPTIDNGRIPLTLFLLSPAQRPIQVTRDLPGFWRGSWADVRADLRGRYPKHDWPEHPASAKPATGAKRRNK